MSTLRFLRFAVLPALLFVSITSPGFAQPTQGTVTTVSGQTLRVQLDDSLAVEAGTVGRVVEQQTVGGDPVQMSFAVVTVERVERSFDGPWVAICQITRQSENLEVDDRVLFEAVYPRPHLSIRTTPPNVTVYIDDEHVGATPLDGFVEAGRHALRLERNGFHSKSRPLTLSRGDRITLRDTLRTARGTLVVNTLPDSALVQVDGRSLGRSPVSEKMQSGTYDVVVKRKGYLPVDRTIKIPSGEENRINLDLKRPLQVSLADRQSDPIVNAHVSREADRLVLEYDLVGDAEAYTVELLLSTDGGQSFEPLPETVAGTVGDEVSPGRGKQLVWSALEDFPKGLTGSGNRLRLKAEPEGGNGIYWVLGSAVAAGAGATAAAVLGVFGGGGGGGDLPSAPPSPPN